MAETISTFSPDTELPNLRWLANRFPELANCPNDNPKAKVELLGKIEGSPYKLTIGRWLDWAYQASVEVTRQVRGRDSYHEHWRLCEGTEIGGLLLELMQVDLLTSMLGPRFRGIYGHMHLKRGEIASIAPSLYDSFAESELYLDKAPLPYEHPIKWGDFPKRTVREVKAMTVFGQSSPHKCDEPSLIEIAVADFMGMKELIEQGKRATKPLSERLRDRVYFFSLP